MAAYRRPFPWTGHVVRISRYKPSHPMKQTTTRPDQPDDVLTLLADADRRAIIAYFRNAHSDDATVSELATHIRDRRDDHGEQETARLHHVHLPRLAEAGVVEYDPRSETVRYQGTDDVEALVDCLAELHPDSF